MQPGFKLTQHREGPFCRSSCYWQCGQNLFIYLFTIQWVQQ